MQKKSIIVSICIVVVIIGIIALTIYNINGGALSSEEISKTNGELLKPQIEISINSEDENLDSVTINVVATIDGDDEIVLIKLPNDKEVKSSKASYEVFENGEYSFSAESGKGAITTKTINIDNIVEKSSDIPYIPDGFEHIDGTTIEDGYVIKDEYDNEFVWVPVSNGILIRNIGGNTQFEEVDSTASGLYNSVAKYYGFYIARYEASKLESNGLVVAKSVYDEIPWSNVKYDEAYSACLNASSVYKYTGVKTALMNSFAWDTTLNWLNQKVSNYSTSTSYGNYNDGVILKTGNTETDEINSICDMAGNLREWTTEMYYPAFENEDEEEIESDEELELVNYRVVRGGSANLNKVANSRTGNREDMSDVYWGFRMILYKD